MEIGALADLLDAGQFHECRVAAETLLRHGNLSPVDKAQVYLALSSSLAGLQSRQEALGPGELAAYFCRETGQYDLLGRTLYHLGLLYHEVRLHKRALTCLQEYFRYVTLYERARALEGRVLYRTARCYQAMGRGSQAVEYFRKALQWQEQNHPDPRHCERYRTELAHQYLLLGEVEQASLLLADTTAYLQRHPNDLEIRAHHLNNAALRALTKGDYAGAIRAVDKVIRIRSITPEQKAQAYLTLLGTARGMGRHKEAAGIAVLAKIQAGVARRPDLEEEVFRQVIQMQQQGGIPPVDELFRQLNRIVQPGAL